MNQHTPRTILRLLPLAAGMFGLCGPVDHAAAQNAVPVATARAAQAGQPVPANAVKPATPAGQPGKPTKPGEAQPKNPAAKPGDEKGKAEGKKEPEQPKVIKRGDKPESPADPKELLVRPDENNLLHLGFHGQPWPDVLHWLAEVSGLSLDWQELPGDYLNLTTQRGYTVQEVRDLINRHLLARGYTMLRQGEVLWVCSIKSLDPSLVPRVDPEELKDRDPYEFVKVSFELEWILAERAEEEFKPMLSPNAKITKLTSTNRLEAMDAVLNLREVYRVLQEEQSGRGQESLMREFQLLHTRVDDVMPQLQALIGQESKGGGGAPMSPQQMQQMQQQMQQMMRQQQQQAQKGGGAPTPKAEVHLVANPRKNSVLVNAPPDKMALIEKAIEAIDQPLDGSRSLLRNMNRMQVYRLGVLDPEPLVKTLEELGDLDPMTHLEVDTQNRAIIAYATLADHVTINELIKKLDGSGREFHVIPLRRLAADYVAGTIEFMMGTEEKKEDNSRMSSFYVYDRFGSSRQSQNTGPEDKFKVDADIENNRLVLKCNDIELAEIENLLIKLGEIPARDGNPNRVRVIEANPEDVDELLRRVQRDFERIQPNKLKIDPSLLVPQTPRDPAPEATGREAKRPDEPETPTQRTSAPGDGRQPEKEAEPGVQPLPAQPTSDGETDRRVALLLRRGPGGKLVQFTSTGSGNEGETAENAAGSDSAARVPSRELASGEGPAGGEAAASGGPAGKAGVPADRGLPGRAASEATGPDGLPSERSRRGSRFEPETRQFDSSISITRGFDGQLVIASDDTEALDLLEDLLMRYNPPRRDYVIFHLKHPGTWAYGIELNLKAFLEEEEKEKSGYRYDPFYGRYYSGGNNTDSVRRLSRRRPLKIISDEDSRTILVQGADESQLRMIQELIDLYDQPQSTEGHMVRQTAVFQVKYSKAQVIAETIKDVYRDLLSENDKALQSQNGKDKEKPPERSYTYIYGAGETDGSEPPSPIKFKGLLSIGVDELSNTLVVSATAGLMENVSEMIKALDEAAMPSSSVQVYQVNGGLNTSILQKKLSNVFGKPKPPQGQPGRQPGQPDQPGQQPGQVQPAGENAAAYGGP